jgi:hypothetical protein
MLAKHTERTIDCPDCEASGNVVIGFGRYRCRLCDGRTQIVVTVPVDALDEDIWDATWELRKQRMPDLFEDETNKGAR